MKILCIGDLHLKVSRLSLCQNALKWIETTIALHKPDAIVYLGDVFDEHSTIRSECLGIWTNHLKAVLAFNLPTYWILGNHEMFRHNNSLYNALLPFKHWADLNLKVVTEPTELDGFGFVPYLVDKSWAESVTNMSANIFFTHNTFVGANFGFKISDTGLEPPNDNSFIVSGHIHKRQSLTNKKSIITYPGTPFAWSANDVDEPKGLMLLDTDALKTSFIDSPFSAWTKIQIDTSVPFNKAIANACNPEDHALIKLSGLRRDIKAFIDSEDMAYLKTKFKTVSVSTESLDSARSSSSQRIDAKKDVDAVEIYMNSIYKGSADRDSVKKTVLDALGDIK